MKVNLKRVLKPIALIIFVLILLFTVITIVGAKIEMNCSSVSRAIIGDKENILLEPNKDESVYYKNGGKIPLRIREQLKCERGQMRPILIYGGLIFISALVAVIIWRKNRKHRTPQ